MTGGVFLFLFLQTHFANLKFVHFVKCTVRFWTLKRYISKHIGWEAFWFSKNLYGKVANDLVPNFQQPKIFRREVISKNELETPKFSGHLVEFDWQKYHAHTMGAYVDGLGS